MMLAVVMLQPVVTKVAIEGICWFKGLCRDWRAGAHGMVPTCSPPACRAEPYGPAESQADGV